MKKGIIKTKITANFILDLYDKAKKLKNREKKTQMMKQIKVLSKHIGEYIVKTID